MKKLFLTSSVHAVAAHIAKQLDLSTHNKLVFITTAADFEKGDKEWLRNDRQSLVDAGFSVEDYTIVGKTSDKLKSDLSGYDFIYMSGGNTLHLLKQSQMTGFITIVRDMILKDGKVYIGTSAGSIITGPKVPDYLEDEEVSLENRDGYGFVNFTLVPHWGNDRFRERYIGAGKRLVTAYKEEQVPLLLLTDTQYVHVMDDAFEIVEVREK